MLTQQNAQVSNTRNNPYSLPPWSKCIYGEGASEQSTTYTRHRRHKKRYLLTSGAVVYGGQTAGMFGYSHFTGGFAGGQAEYVRVPLGDVNLLEIPDDVPDEKALYLSDVLATSYNAVHDTAVYPGDQVAIFGAGPIGQMAGIFAIGAGATKIIFVDTEPRLSFVRARWPREHADKLELVDFKQLSFGVTNKETVVSKLKELCGGRGPDAAIEVG